MDKLFLLGLFAAGLLISQYLVLVRNRIELSLPIHLEDTGLSIRLPVGPGWQAIPTWRWDRRERMNRIEAQFNAPSHSATVKCGFRPNAANMTVQDRLDRHAAQWKVTPEQGGELYLKNIEIRWFWGQPEKSTYALFYGVGVTSPDQAILELEVLCQTDPDLAMRIFMSVANGLRYRPKSPPPDPKSIARLGLHGQTRAYH